MQPVFQRAILIGLWACAAFAQRPNRPADKANPLGHTPDVVEKGRQLYNSSCTMCHGLEGTAGDRGPALAATRRYLRSGNAQIFAAIKDGIAGTLMPPTRLPDADIWRIVAYIRSLRATAADEFVQGDVKRGESIFAGKGRCVECHMVGGKGGLLGPDLSNIAAERSVKFLRESLTKSRELIPRGYQPVRLTTGDGQQLEGLVKNEDNFSLQVMDRKYQIHLLLRQELRNLDYGKQSWMPSDYDRVLDSNELQDLLAFLSRQARGRSSDTPDLAR